MTPASLPKAETFTALRNLLYAFEWWVFGGFAVYCGGAGAATSSSRQRTRRRARRPARRARDPPGDGPGSRSDPRVSGSLEYRRAREDRPARYRVMANVVGVLLIVLILVGVPLKYLTQDGTSPQHARRVGSPQYLGIAHGWLYMVFLLVAFLLSRQARWSIGFTLVTLLCGTVPFAVLLGRAPGHRRGRAPSSTPSRDTAPVGP